MRPYETKDQQQERQAAAEQKALFASCMPTRAERRLAARRGLVECACASAECVALRAALAAIQSEMDAAGDKHVKTCEPIQRELKQLGDDTVTRILEGQCGADCQTDKRRSELLSELSAANAELEDTLRTLKARSIPIYARMCEAGSLGAKLGHFENELVATADWQLIAESRVAGHTLELAQSRLDRARDLSRQYPGDQVWQLELSTAEKLHEEADLASRRAYRQLIESE